MSSKCFNCKFVPFLQFTVTRASQLAVIWNISGDFFLRWRLRLKKFISCFYQIKTAIIKWKVLKITFFSTDQHYFDQRMWVIYQMIFLFYRRKVKPHSRYIRTLNQPLTRSYSEPSPVCPKQIQVRHILWCENSGGCLNIMFTLWKIPWSVFKLLTNGR